MVISNLPTILNAKMKLRKTKKKSAPAKKYSYTLLNWPPTKGKLHSEQPAANRNKSIDATAAIKIKFL